MHRSLASHRRSIHALGPALRLALGVYAVIGGGCGAPPDAAPNDVGETEAALRTKGLTARQTKVALKAIDDICGDTWCSGDYDFRFPKIVCKLPGSCTVTMEIIARFDNPPWSVYRSCKVTGVTDYTSVVTTPAHGQPSLNQDFYGELTTCISGIEGRLRHP